MTSPRPSGRLPLLAWLLVAATAGALGPPSEAPAASGVAPARERPFLRGMVVSCPRWGPIWGEPAMDESLAEVRQLGVDWVAIHPYGWLRRDGTIEFRPAAELGFLDRAVEKTRAHGLEMFWKPHLGYWGSFRWRGDVQFGEDEEAWRRFFDGYRRFIVDQARFAQRAGLDLFAVGVELERTTGREEEWRRILAEVRRVYRGRLVYAANWDSLDKVPFWDAVDLIGVHAYFPLAERDDPDREELARAWERHLHALEQLSERHGGKPVLFAEIGYNRAADAARRPWVYGSDDSPANRELRRRLLDVALERIERSPFIEGMFWWKWMPGYRGRDYSMKDPEAREALRRHWADPAPPSPPARPTLER